MQQSDYFLLNNHEAIGTKWWIELLGDKDQLSIPENEFTTLKLRVTNLMSGFEALYSRFKDSSLIGQLNLNKSLRKPPNELLQMIHWGEELKEVSNMHFNLTAGVVLEDMGYDKNYSFKSKEALHKNISSGFKEISENLISIYDDIRVDLGGIGKGWLIDKVADLLIENNANQFLINGGGDLKVKSNDELQLQLESPFEEGKYIGEIKLKSRSLGSSSPKLRKWKDKRTGRTLNHLVNMQNQSNVADIVAVFTTAKNAKLADAISTVIFVSALNIAKNVAEKYGVEYAIIYSNGSYVKSENFEGEFYT